MELQRRTWLKSRGVWAGTVYLIFAWLLGKYVAPRTEALWPWAWPWSGYIVFGLLMLAVLVLVGIMLYVFVYYMAGPALTSIVEKELDKRTAKAKEKYADGLMSLNTAICSATFIAVLLFPLTAFIQSISNMTNPVVQMPWVLRISGMWEALLFDVVLFTLFFLPLRVATWFRRRALALYDEIATLAPTGAPASPGTPERPSAAGAIARSDP